MEFLIYLFYNLCFKPNSGGASRILKTVTTFGQVLGKKLETGQQTNITNDNMGMCNLFLFSILKYQTSYDTFLYFTHIFNALTLS